MQGRHTCTKAQRGNCTYSDQSQWYFSVPPFLKGSIIFSTLLQVSPSCTFLSCIHRNSFNPSSDTPLTNGSIYDEEAEDLAYRISTGEVVDETKYPKAPHMRSEEARLQTFSSWPCNAPVRPRDLAQAGLFYLGEGDHVQCFCCGGRLHGWEAGDTAWEEHTKHYHYCFFILGHDVGNIPLQGGILEEEYANSSQQSNRHVHMESFEERLCSFEGVQHPIDHEKLARAGFYSAGRAQMFDQEHGCHRTKEILNTKLLTCSHIFFTNAGSTDKVLCFRCGGGLKGWQPEEDPWEEHAKHYPG